MVSEDSWYTALRESYRPAHVRLLLIGESAPDVSASPDDRRFFYSTPLTRYDNLFRAVVDALYDTGPLRQGFDKTPLLERLRDEGVFLIDEVPFPVNGPDMKPRRRRLWREYAADCAERAAALDPDGVVIAHAGVYGALRPELDARGLRVLHDDALPFPGMGGQRVFREGLREAKARL